MSASANSRAIQQATSPRAAAIMGILFAVLFAISIGLVRLAVPADVSDVSGWSETGKNQVSLALRLMPFAGIFFLWFVAVIRDRLGESEDKFFATVMLGSGLLFLGMTFVACAIGAGMLASFQIGGSHVMQMDVYLFGRSTMSQVFNTYALKMAGVFMLSLSTLWLRTGVMPRILSYFTYALAIVMLVSLSLNLWMVQIFPAWVLVVSVYILILNVRRWPSTVGDGMTSR